ncbi:hypothetical protein Tco_0489697 [Tanacetum coccineum]
MLALLQFCCISKDSFSKPTFILSNSLIKGDSLGIFFDTGILTEGIEEDGMLLTRLFKHVMSVFPELAIDLYISHDRVMHPRTPHYERKTRSNHGKKRPRESNASSSSTTLNHPSPSHPLDDPVDENDDESFHSNSSSPSQNISSSSNVVFRVHQNPPHESHYLNTHLSKTINLQTQQRDAHWEGLR